MSAEKTQDSNANVLESLVGIILQQIWEEVFHE